MRFTKGIFPCLEKEPEIYHGKSLRYLENRFVIYADEISGTFDAEQPENDHL